MSINKRECTSTTSTSRKRQTLIAPTNSSMSKQLRTENKMEKDDTKVTSSAKSFQTQGRETTSKAADVGVGGSLEYSFPPQHASQLVTAQDSATQTPGCATMVCDENTTPDTSCHQTITKSSCEGTTVSGDHNNLITCSGPTKSASSTSVGFQTLDSTPPTTSIHTDSFPIFRNGDAFITSHLVSPPMQWQLHSEILASHSVWFARSMQDDPNTEQPQTSWYAYTIEEVDSCVQIFHRDARGSPPKVQYTDTTAPPSETCIEIEDTNDHPHDITSSKSHISTPFPSLETYTNLLLTFYSYPPVLSPSFHTALRQAEALLSLSSTLQCTPTLAPHLCTILSSHHKALYTAISIDPPRWLLLSLSLHDKSLFTESLIHLIGAYPLHPWPTPSTALPPPIHQLIKAKSRNLSHVVETVQRELLLLTIENPNRSPVQPTSGDAEFNTWFLVSLFRSTLATEINALHHSERGVRTLVLGTFFRKLEQGGDAYMREGEVRRLLERVMPSAVEGFEEDLELLKGAVRGIVESLARNGLILDVWGGRGGVWGT